MNRYAALDGVRGLAIVVLLAYHFGASFLPGAWIGLNLFFVFSGYIVTRILLKEYERFGSIDALGFYKRRARRLLPALFVLLIVLAGWALIDGTISVRRQMRGDILATSVFSMNWRLIHQADAYFNDFGTPSFLRHVWTLSVEEQFYVLVPFVAFALLRFVHTRRTAVLLLLGGAVASAVWMAHIGVVGARNQAHAYYGTDTRVQAILVGVALAFAFGPWRGKRIDIPDSRWVSALGWAAVMLSFLGFATIGPMTAWMFTRGGLLLYSFVAAAAIIACVSPRPNSLSTAFSIAPLTYLGERTYGLYLWHWPIAVWLTMYAPGLDGLALFVVGVGSTVAIAHVSYRFVELPVLAGSLDRRGVLASVSALAMVVAAALWVGRVPTVDEQIASGDIPPLVAGQAPYSPADHTLDVALFGDSVPYFLAEQFPSRTFSDMTVANLAEPGCDLLLMTVQWSPEVTRAPEPGCVDMREHFAQNVEASRAQVVVLEVGSTLALPHIDADGTVIEPGSKRMHQLVDTNLDELYEESIAGGAQQVQLVTLPCRDNNVDSITFFEHDVRPWLREHPQIVADMANPVEANEWMTQWAEAHGVAVLDLYSALGCQSGYRSNINGIDMFSDQLHFSDQAGPMVWTWLAPAIREAWEQQ